MRNKSELFFLKKTFFSVCVPSDWNNSLKKICSDPISTYPNNQWRRNYKENDTKADSSSVNDRAERLGFSTGYGGTQGYPYSGSGVGVYSPLKIDLGGVVIGALIGIGALLIVPKFLSAFNGGYGGAGNYRSIVLIEI